MGCSKDTIFNSRVELLNKFETDSTRLKDEPMFFNSTLTFALENGGEITKSFLEALPEEWWDTPAVFDSRVHMLMPGWFPAIPGWHHDDVPRPKIPAGQHFITAGQPDYDNPSYKSEHILGLVNGDICPTQFIIGECPMKAVTEGDLIYRQWHKEIEVLIADKKVEVVEAPSNQLVYFNWQTFHTGVRATKSGWRWFGRVSRNTDRANEVTNEIRRQAQVYMEFPMEGW